MITSSSPVDLIGAIKELDDQQLRMLAAYIARDARILSAVLDADHSRRRSIEEARSELLSDLHAR